MVRERHYENKKVVILVTSGHGKVIMDIVRQSGDDVLGFLDDHPPGMTFMGCPVLGDCTVFANWPDAYFVIGIGNAAIRERLAEKMRGVKWYIAVHPRAVVSLLDVTIAEGSVVMAGAIISPGVRIGEQCIVNTGAIVDHDARIADYAHISVRGKAGEDSKYWSTGMGRYWSSGQQYYFHL